MSATVWYQQGIKCGHCKKYHTSIDQVRFCSQGLPAYTTPATGYAQSPATGTRRYLPPPPPPVRVPEPIQNFRPASVEPKEPYFDELQVLPGRYAVENNNGELRFYTVRENTHPKYKRYRKVLVQASDNEHFIKDWQAKKAILKKILEVGMEISSLRYGLELGVCGVCGRTLTDEDSRAMGIGPVCREKMGWF